MTGEEVEQPVTKPQAKEPETVTLSKAEHAALIRERDEARESEKFWATRARGGKEETLEPEDEPIETDGLVPEVTGNEDVDEAIFNDPEKWTEAITKGPQAIEKFVKKMGYVSAKEAAEIAVRAARQEVGRTVQNMQTDNQLVTDFPDMRDSKSDLFKAAAPIYQNLVKMNGGKQSTALLHAAATAAKATISAKAPPARQRDDDDYERYEAEDERRARADAQGASRGRRAPVQDDDEGGVGPAALDMIRQMNASGGPQITEADFIASQKQLGSRRRR